MFNSSGKYPLGQLSLHAKTLIFAGLVCLLIVGIDSFRTWSSRLTTLADVQVDTLNLARSLAQQAQDSLQNADIPLIGLKERVEIDGIGPEQTGRLHNLMKTFETQLPTLHSLIVIDAQGHAAAWSSGKSAADMNYGDRDYFQYFATHPSGDVRVSGPLVSKLDGTWIIAVARRWNHADGGFGGVVVATIAADFFQHFYATVNVGKKGAIVLIGSDDAIIVRKPFDAANVGRRLALDPVFSKRLITSGTGDIDQVSPIDSVRRIGSVYRLQRYPLSIFVARSKHEALTGWREEARTHLIGVIFLAIIVALLGKRLADQIRAAQKAEKLYRLLADNSSDAIICSRLDGSRSYISPSFETLTGWETGKLLNCQRDASMHPDDRKVVQQKLAALHEGDPQVTVTFRQLCRDGSYIWMEAGVRLAAIGPNGSMEFIGNVRDISARKLVEDQLAAANQDLVTLTVTDALTGIANRRKFDEVIGEEWARARREEMPVSLLLIDVDLFKKYNDHYGHQKGDACLSRVAETIDGAVYRSGDLAARIGGEEFAVLLPRSNSDVSSLMAERVRQAIQDLRIEHMGSPKGWASVSIGVATAYPAQGVKLSALMQQADRALYAAKSKGRDRVEVASGKGEVGHAA